MNRRKPVHALMAVAALAVGVQTRTSSAQEVVHLPPVVVEAESGEVGTDFVLDEAGGFISVSPDSPLDAGLPGLAERVVRLSVSFPEPGDYEIYLRYRVGPETFSDDSFFLFQRFGALDPAVAGDWVTVNGLAGVGYNAPEELVEGVTHVGLDASAFRWLNLTRMLGSQPLSIADGDLVQSFDIGAREDGLDLDRFAFVKVGTCNTVAELDAGAAGSACPEPEPCIDYVPEGPPLASSQEKYLGCAYSAAQAVNFPAYFNQLTPENAGKWGSVEAVRDEMNWTGLDAAYETARANGMPMRMHVLVWGNQQPQWIAELPPEEQLAEIEEWFAAVSERYPDLDWIEVVNEPLHDPPDDAEDGGYIEALGGLGESGYEWVLNSFRLARNYFPDGKLVLNDYSIVNTPNDAAFYVEIIQALQAEGLIDAIGVQGHAFSTGGSVDTMRSVLDLLGDTGLPVIVTELDIDSISYDDHVQRYQRIFPLFWEHPAVEGITLWGYRPGMWRTQQGAPLVKECGEELPSMLWLKGYLANVAPFVEPGQVFEVSEAAEQGQVLGAVQASDEAGVLGDWAIVGGNVEGAFRIDPLTGELGVERPELLDYEAERTYRLQLSVRDEFTSSAPEWVTINLLNANDSFPVVDAGQAFAIDAGRDFFGAVVASDLDDSVDPEFTTLEGWAIVGGTGAELFDIDPELGTLSVRDPVAVDYRSGPYTLEVTVSDGENTSAPREVLVEIPRRVQVCVHGASLRVRRSWVRFLVERGASLGACESSHGTAIWWGRRGKEKHSRHLGWGKRSHWGKSPKGCRP